MKVILVTLHKKPITIGVGSFAFSIKDGKVIHNEDSKVGSQVKNELDAYNEAFDLATFAWENEIFDDTEEH